MAKLKTGRHTSSLKAARKAVKRHWANMAVKTRARELAKNLTAAIGAKDAGKVKALLPQVVSAWQKMGRKNVIHHANASRKIARFSRAAGKVLGKAS